MDDHFIRELQQITLLQKKLDDVLDDDIPNEQKTTHVIEHIESVNSFATKFVNNVSSGKVKITKDFLTTLNHELKTPLVPIRTYSEMLLQGKFGKLNPEQEKRLELLVLSTQQLQKKIESACAVMDHDHDKTESPNEHKILELEQEKIILQKVNELLDKKINDESIEIKALKNDLNKSEHQKKEFEQEKIILNKTVHFGEQKNLLLAKKNLIIIAIAAVIVGVGFTAYSVYVVNLVGSQYQVTNLGKLNSGGYVIQNLRGDTIDTWLSWRLVSGSVIHIGIVNGARFQEKIPLIKEAIESEESIQVDDSLLHKGPKGSVSTYYIGWQGALKHAAAKPTQFYIPTKLEVIDSERGEGEITIILTDDKSGDGYSGYTKSIADDSQNQILKSTITIYDVGSLNNEQFEAILRHEFGHALGLGHSTAPEELMAPTIITLYPYISDCDINTLVDLYDGSKKSQVVCDK